MRLKDTKLRPSHTKTSYSEGYCQILLQRCTRWILKTLKRGAWSRRTDWQMLWIRQNNPVSDERCLESCSLSCWYLKRRHAWHCRQKSNCYCHLLCATHSKRVSKVVRRGCGCTIRRSRWNHEAYEDKDQSDPIHSLGDISASPHSVWSRDLLSEKLKDYSNTSRLPFTDVPIWEARDGWLSCVGTEFFKIFLLVDPLQTWSLNVFLIEHKNISSRYEKKWMTLEMEKNVLTTWLLLSLV